MFSQYLLSPTSLATWGYPLPMSISLSDLDSHPTDSDSSQQMKRRRIEEETNLSTSFPSPVVQLLPSASLIEAPHSSFVGLRSGTLLTLEESQRRLATGNRILVTDSKDSSLWKKKKSDISSPSPVLSQSHVKQEEAPVPQHPPYFFQTIHNPSAVFGPCCSAPDCQCNLCSSNRELLGLDCEMCDTEAGLELTRISIVDFNGVVLLDSLVKPLTPILNYRQEFSGISAELLDPVTISLEQIQLACLQIISAETILVGHSLENDLRALRLCHLRCIDTSVIYPHPKGYPLRNKLKYLAKEYLGKEIQSRNQTGNSPHPQLLVPAVCDWNGGHSSVEDAWTAVELVKLKATHGPKFGIKGKNSLDSREPLLSFLPLHVTSVFHWTDSDTMHAMRSCVSPRSDGILCSRNSETIHKAMKRFESFQRTGSSSPSAHSLHFISLDLEGLPQQRESAKFEEEVVVSIENHLQEQRDVLLMICHEKSPQKLLELQRRKTACMKTSSVSVWSEELEEELQREAVERNIVEMRLGIISKRLPRQQHQQQEAASPIASLSASST
jgi:DNA polymerase III epsilon subunit-like protein